MTPKAGSEVASSRTLITSFTQLRKAQRYLKIERVLARAIAICPDERQSLRDVLLERARNRLLLERYDQALSDTIEVGDLLATFQDGKRNDLQTQLQDCTTLRARCLYALRRWQEAEKAYRQVFGDDPLPMSDPVAAELEQCRLRMQEQATGEFDDVGLFRQIHRDGLRRLDIANYVGPVEVVEYSGMGRGYRTTRDVKAGELLVVDKALAMVEPAKLESEDDIRFVGFNMLTRSIEAAGSHALRSELAYVILHQPDAERELQNLHAGDGLQEVLPGSKAGESAHGPQVVDVRQIDGAVTYNILVPRDLDYAVFVGRSEAGPGKKA